MNLVEHFPQAFKAWQAAHFRFLAGLKIAQEIVPSMPRAIQASRGNAPKDGTSPLTLSNMKAFMTPDAPYMSAASTCKTHNSMFIVCPRLPQ